MVEWHFTFEPSNMKQSQMRKAASSDTTFAYAVMNLCNCYKIESVSDTHTIGTR